MPRPNKLRCPTRTVNCILRDDQYEALTRIAASRSKWEGRQISVSDLIRQAVDNEFQLTLDRVAGSLN